MWQPIETAPLGVEVQAVDRLGNWEPRARLIERADGARQWQVFGLNFFDCLGWVRASVPLTYWMHQPSMPDQN